MKSNTDENPQERRRYFRIEDTVIVHYEVLTAEEAAQKESELKQINLRIPDRLRDTEKELQLLIDKLRIQNPQFANAIELLNVKFNVLKQSQPERFVRKHGVEESVKEVSISACGIAFDTHTRLQVDRMVYLDITLLPSDIHILTLAKVVACDPATDKRAQDPWSLRLDFYHLPMEDEELLVQHIVKRQGRLISAQKSRQSN
jgi:hypothetical protein|tara:strand:- start:453 stop:1058 length:606 start_codon:yes stop_codon:yes gene_type:complete